MKKGMELMSIPFFVLAYLHMQPINSIFALNKRR